MSKRVHLLVDADILVYQFAAVHEFNIDWDEETSSEVLQYEDAVYWMTSFVADLLNNTGTKEVTFCFSSREPCFRYDILPTYKHNRKDQVRPKLLDDLRTFIEENYRTYTRPRLEADDVMGILATISPGKYTIASIDKDLRQIPGRLYNWRDGSLIEVSEEEADRYFYMQVLTGDPTDGYSGCPGIGPKRAERLLDGVGLEDMWSVIVEAYEAKGLTEEDALQQARVARILRKNDYDFKNKRPKLWAPSK